MTGSLPPAAPNQTPDNRREEILVHFLLDRLTDQLTDRGGSVHHFPWEPDQEVRIGVLGPTYRTLTPDDDGDDTDDEDSEADQTSDGTVTPPVDNTGVIGVDFVVDSDHDTIDIDVTIDYALYHPLVPDHPTIAAEAQRLAQAAASNPRRRPTVTVKPSWTRDDRNVALTLTVPTDGAETTSLTIPGGDPLEADAKAAVGAHYAGPDAHWPLANRQTIPVAEATGTAAEFRQALLNRRDTGWQPSGPQPRVTAAARRTSTPGEYLVSVSVTNEREVFDRSPQSMSIYDTRMQVTVASPATIEPQRSRFADVDLRYSDAATIVGRGRGCVAEPGEQANQIVAQTLPLHRQQDAQTTDHGVDLRYATLANGYDTTLDTLGARMRAFLRSWDPNAAATPEARAQSKDLRNDFEAEVERFELGCDLLRTTPMLAQAFRHANAAFAQAKGPDAAWRLFQLIFVVTELGALAGREAPHDLQLRKELDAVDVLWFPTGGGKTEAYLGLIAVALFFDRLRGKQRGASAWLLFPLRMLSVQQLARVATVVHHCEAVRDAHQIGGDAFTLGYLVGSGNTPNRLGRPEQNGWWPGIAEFATWDPDKRDERRLLGACPACGKDNSVGLDADLAGHRLLHRCRTCGHELGIHSSDEEVTRYQPSVLISTVDKITSFARNGELTSINRGPRKRCPSHGWYTHDACVVPDCSTDASTHPAASGFKDATPALWIQDELHLVREDLGVFAGHYHTLLAELARGAGNEPSKVIAATATIEQYEDQLVQVYGRTPRMFPVGGPTLERSFYTELTDDVRRMYLGILPAGGGTAKVDLAGKITTHLVEEIHRLTDDPMPVLAEFSGHGMNLTGHEAADLLFDYELALAYVNSKAHGVSVHDDIDQLAKSLLDRGEDPVRSKYLMGDTPLGELAGVIAAVQGDDLSTPRADRIRALVGTSVVSHGVDLDRLNFEVLAGMPPSYAHYIQATARAGRTHVGLVVSVFDRWNRRETSMYQSFHTTHRALERMVEPVPVNRYAARAVQRTLPGIVCALLWDETRNSSWGTTDRISFTRKFQDWWNREAHQLSPALIARIEAAYRCPVPRSSAKAQEDELAAAAVDRWISVEEPRMTNWQAEWLTDLFTRSAMTSLRDVAAAVEFAAGGPNAAQIIDRL